MSGKALAAGSLKMMLFLILVHVVELDDEIKDSQQEAAGPAGPLIERQKGVVASRAGASTIASISWRGV